ncbi:hypothetical protein DE146DRAFT_39452 [Phaeosphaeria sp. MPI-PUGE-AT-0046c]|nr:hypothetical protein DE146DRAFT_39452 [Phaeosphaeria sp. MPI-PUGE-AT-0046c]
MPSANGIPVSCLFWPSMSRRATCDKHGPGCLVRSAHTILLAWLAIFGLHHSNRCPQVADKYSSDQSQCRVLEALGGSPKCGAPGPGDGAMEDSSRPRDKDEEVCPTRAFDMSAMIAAQHVHCAVGSRRQSLGLFAFPCVLPCPGQWSRGPAVPFPATEQQLLGAAARLECTSFAISICAPIESAGAAPRACLPSWSTNTLSPL